MTLGFARCVISVPATHAGIDVDRDHPAGSRRQRAGERTEPAADLEHLAVGTRVERLDDGVQHVAIDEEVLAEARVPAEPDAPRHGRERPGIGQVERMACALGARVLRHALPAARAVAIPSTRWAVRVVAARTSSTVSPRRRATAAAVMATRSGRFGLPRSGTGLRNGESVSTTKPSSRDRARRVLDALGARKRDDARERGDETSVGTASRERGVAAEAVHDAPAAGDSAHGREHLLVRVAVVDEHRLAGGAGELEHRLKRALLDVERHLVVPGPEEQVESHLPHRDRLGVAEQLGERLELARVGRGRLVRMPSAREVHAGVRAPRSAGCDPSPRG